MIDDEIKDALNVEPSPGFPARVRSRIASEPAPSTWRWSWTVAAVGALAAVVLIAVVFSRPTRENPSARQAVPDGVQAFRPAQAPAGPTGPARQPADSATSPGAQPTRSAIAIPVLPRVVRSVPAPAEPEILLDPAETRALRRLIAGVRDGRIDLAAAQRSVPLAPMEPAPIVAIDIAPLGIEPIAPPSGAEGVRP